MRIRTLALWAVLLAAAVPASLAAEKWEPLFNGRDFTGWRVWLGKPPPAVELPGLAKDAEGRYTEFLGYDRDPLQVFSVVEVDGRPAIRISGAISGSLIEDRTWSNYRLRLQYKWGAKTDPNPNRRRNAGLMYHCHTEPGFAGSWPGGHEFQTAEQQAGDYWSQGTGVGEIRARKVSERDYVYDPAAEPLMFGAGLPAGRRCQKGELAESTPGEWTNLELVCFGEQVAQVINGKTVLRFERSLRATGDGKFEPVTAGKILLQSEGAEVFIRDVEIAPLTSAPPELAGAK